MLGGIITATLTSWITERTVDDNIEAELTTHQCIDELEGRINALREEIRVSQNGNSHPTEPQVIGHKTATRSTQNGKLC